ncbi:hypothetical protein C4D60_Mb06t22520 [Musa balbisiana]|uniref:WD repeat-containing protein 55 n=1 Tax=Musa balbisiana TaxID=52838 RepID=A0A4S8IQ33_MUSBA|nr:hypothetical protein C4D60_Mb06t22520 [Musa balbisiana]
MEINLGKLPFDLDFHPSSPLVAAGLINGDLHLYRYVADSQPQRLLEVHAHDESCRATRFVDSGRVILTASPDCSILATDVRTGKAIARLEEAHGDAINRLVNLTETTIASGDDEGKLPNNLICYNSSVMLVKFVIVYVVMALYQSAVFRKISGDGTLSVCSLQKNKIQSQSEFSEDELLSLVIMKNGRKVICGTQTGTLLLYSWGHFKDCSDRFLGHPMSIDTLLKLDEDTLISGSEDGVIRLVGILPNRIIQPLAEHSEYPIERLAFSNDRKFLGSISHDQMLKLDEDTLISGSEDGVIRLVGILPNRIIQPLAEHSEYPIERLAFSNDRKFLGSISHDQMLKLWDLQELLDNCQGTPEDQMVEADSDEEEMDMDVKPHKSSKGTRRKKLDKGKSSNTSAADFFADL